MIDLNDVLVGAGLVATLAGAWFVATWAGVALVIGACAVALGTMRQMPRKG